jgi:hypothetical protein
MNPSEGDSKTRVKELEDEIRTLRDIIRCHMPDLPEDDGTDFAHPAWWRGNDAGVIGAARVVERALQVDDWSGTVASSELQAVCDAITHLKARHKQALKLLNIYGPRLILYEDWGCILRFLKEEYK